MAASVATPATPLNLDVSAMNAMWISAAATVQAPVEAEDTEGESDDEDDDGFEVDASEAAFEEEPPSEESAVTQAVAKASGNPRPATAYQGTDIFTSLFNLPRRIKANRIPKVARPWLSNVDLDHKQHQFESMLTPFGREVMLWLQQRGLRFPKHVLKKYPPISADQVQSTMKPGLYLGTKNGDEAYIGRSVHPPVRREQHRAATFSNSKTSLHYTIARSCGGFDYYLLAECDASVNDWPMCLAVFENAFLDLFRACGLTNDKWDDIVAACEEEGLPDLAMVGCNSTICLDGPQQPPNDKRPYGPQDALLRSLTASMRSIAADVQMRATGDQNTSALMHRLSEQRDKRLCDLLLSEDGYIFRPRDQPEQRRQMKIPILKFLLHPHFEVLINRQLKAVGRSLFGDPEPNDLPETLLSARLEFHEEGNCERDFFARAGPVLSRLLHGTSITLQVVPLEGQPALPPIAILAFWQLSESPILQRLSDMFWPLVPPPMKVTRLEGAIKQLEEMRGRKRTQVYRDLPDQLKPFFSGQVAWTTKGFSIEGEKMYVRKTFYSSIASVVQLAHVPEARCGSALRFDCGVGHKVVDLNDRAIFGWPSDARVQFANHHGDFETSNGVYSDICWGIRFERDDPLPKLARRIFKAYFGGYSDQHPPDLARWQVSKLAVYEGRDGREVQFELGPGNMALKLGKTEVEDLQKLLKRDLKHDEKVLFRFAILDIRRFDDFFIEIYLPGHWPESLFIRHAQDRKQDRNSILARAWRMIVEEIRLDELDGMPWPGGITAAERVLAETN